MSAYAMACREKLDWPKNDPKTGVPSWEYVVLPPIRAPIQLKKQAGLAVTDAAELALLASAGRTGG